MTAIYERNVRIRRGLLDLSRHAAGEAPLPAPRVAAVARALVTDLQERAMVDGRGLVEVDTMLLAAVVMDLAAFYEAAAESERVPGAEEVGRAPEEVSRGR